MSLELGARLGPYEILSFIGAGGMGEVYEARDPRLERTVAIKVLPSSLFQNPERLRRFEQEAKTAGSLNHTNLVTIYDIGLEGEFPYLVMELLEGETLRARLRDPLPFRKTVEYALQIAHGIAAAHEKGIIHRDLKPENVFVTRDGRLKILDFGLAKQAISGSGDEASQYLTQSRTADGIIVGTAGYISPEQIRGLPADARSDIFAFGAILYEMLSGQRAFHAPSTMETMTEILTKDPLSAESVASFPPTLHRILSRSLEKNPSERFQSIRDLAFSIEALSDVSGTAAIPRELQVPPTPMFKRLTFKKGYISAARFAPDDSTVIYSASWNGQPIRVFMSRPDALDSLELSLPDAHLLSLSNTGEMALLLEHEAEVGFAHQGILARAPMIGGRPRQLQEKIGAADWLPDGKNIAIVRYEEPESILEFPAGNEVYRTRGWISKVRVSRNGKLLTFADHPFYGDDSGIVSVIDGNGNKRDLTDRYTALQGIAWSPDDREVWFTATEIHNSERILRAVNLDGQVRVIYRIPSSLILFDVSPSGKVLLSRESPRREVRLLTEDGSERDLSWLNWSFPRSLSADGSQLLFIEEGVLGVDETCVRGTDGSAPIQLGPYIGIEFSPDERHALTVNAFPITKIHMLPLKLGNEHTIPMQDFKCAWTAFKDNNTLLVQGSMKEEPSSLFSIVPGQAMQPLQIRGPDIPTWWISHSVSPDGKSLAGWDAHRKLRIYSLEEDRSAPISDVARNELSILWSLDSSKLYTYRPGGMSITVFCVDVNSGERTVCKQIEPSDRVGIQGLGPLLLSADLRTCVYSFRRSITDLYLAEGI